MSIFEETGQLPQFVSPPERLDRFADRRELVTLFLEKVQAPAVAPQILFIHGMGGNGKSELLRFLEDRCCIRLNAEYWERLRQLPFEVLMQGLQGDTEGVRTPTAMIDFGAKPQGERQPLEAFSGLSIIKEQLARFGIKTPTFDFALVSYLQKSGRPYEGILPELFPTDELDLAISIGDFLSTLPILATARSVGTRIGKMTNHRLAKWWMSRNIEDRQLEHILHVRADPDLADMLPGFLAHDINTYVAGGDDRRVVLLCDTHEAFWGEEAFPTGGSVSFSSVAHDRWLRALLGSLRFRDGVVAVVAGRKPPRWADVEEARIDDRYVEVRPLGGLTRADAVWYLEKVGIRDPAAQTLILDYASAPPEEVHPYMLGLCSDVLAAEPERGLGLSGKPGELEASLEDKRRRLVGRLMSAVSEETHRRVVAVAATRSFDLETFKFLGEQLDFRSALDEFHRLVTFSFVRAIRPAAKLADSSYAVHDLLRRELGRMFSTDTIRAHALLSTFYGAREDAASRAEAAMHLSYVDPAPGVARWCQGIDEYLNAGRLAEAQVFASVAAELLANAEPSADEVIYRVAEVSLGRGAVAEAEALCSQLTPESAEAAQLRTDVEFYRCHFAAAEGIAREGIAHSVEGDVERLRLRLAEILLYRGEFAAAHHVLANMPEPESTRRRIARAMLRGEVDLFSGQVEAAEAQFMACRRLFDGTSPAERDQIALGWILADQGLVHNVRREWDEAFKAYDQSLLIRQKASHARGVANSLLGKGVACCGHGEHDLGRKFLRQAERLTRDQGDTVTLAKVHRAEAVSLAACGETNAAVPMLEEAATAAAAEGTPYDAAHVLLDLAEVKRAAGDERASVYARERARRHLAGRHFGLLTRLYGAAAERPTARIRSGLVAFAVGDAVGAPWEGKTPDKIAFTPSDPIGLRDDWPRGSTTDDTDQLLIAARVLRPDAPAAAEDLLMALSAQLPRMRGVGPTTPVAVERFQRTGSVRATSGGTNGALARGLAVGWATPPAEPALRRDRVDVLTAATHGTPGALVGSRIIAALATWAVEGVSADTLSEIVLEELDVSDRDHPISPEHRASIRAAANGSWVAPTEGVPLDALATTAATVAIITEVDDILEGALRSIRLGGDTDTVSALVLALIGSRDKDESSRLPWTSQVITPPLDELDALAETLAETRHACYS